MPEDYQYNFLQQKAVEYPRVAGLLSIALGFFLFYEGFYSPYLEVKAQISEVDFIPFVTLMGIAVILVGLTLIVSGNKFAPILFMPSYVPNSKKQKILYFAVIALITFATFYGLNKWLESQGYSTI